MRFPYRAVSSILFALTIVLAAAGCVAATGGGTPSPLIDPDWRRHMAAGLDAWELGEIDRAARHYRQALQIAREQELSEEELAFSSYHLGEAIRVRPGSARGETALALLVESRAHFERSYGRDHPVLIPVWVRIAVLQARAGDLAEAARSRARADRIAVRFFPASHFLRERYGVARPALVLQPLEVLQLMDGPLGPPDRMVQGS